MTTAAARPAARPPVACPAPAPSLGAWAGTLTRPGSGIGLWAAAFGGQPLVAALAVLALLAAAALRP